MSIAEKLTAIAENQQRIYQAGYDKGVAEGGGVVGDDYVVEIKPPNTIKTYTDEISAKILDNQFKDFKELTTVAAPNVTHIGNHAFDGCSKLTTVDFNVSIGDFGVPGKTLYAIGEFAFGSCVSLRSITLNVEGFYDDSGIGRYVFSGCTNLEKVDWLHSNCDIREGTFFECSSLTTILLRNDGSSDGLVLENVNALEGTPIANGNGYIYVPSKVIDAYQTNWSTFANQFRALEDYTVDGTVDGELDETKI